ncbi:MAG: hypothetical protein ACXV9R_03855 [Methylobacter sp.]
MQAIKAIYKEGNIHLLSPIIGVDEAELFIIVLDKDDQANAVAESFRAAASSSEEEFQAIGLTSFFNTEDDNKVDWEELFDVKTR